MRFRCDENFAFVCRLHKDFPEKKTADEIAHELCQRYVDAGMINAEGDDISKEVYQIMWRRLIKDVLDVLLGYFGVPSITWDVFEFFRHSRIIDEGDCPECGGPIKFVEFEGHEIKDGDYYTPNSFIIDNYVYKCQECGTIIKSDVEL